MDFAQEIILASDLLYQNQGEACFQWVTSNLKEISEQMQGNAKHSCEGEECLETRLLSQVVEVLNELIAVVKQRDTLALADCLRYKVTEFL